MTIADRIKQARLKAGLTQKELCDRYGIPVRSLQGWEGSSRKPPEYVVNLLVRCLEIDFPSAEELAEQENLSAPKELIFTDRFGRRLNEPLLSAVKRAYNDRKVQYIETLDYEGNTTANELRKGKLYMMLEPEKYGVDMGFEFRVKEG